MHLTKLPPVHSLLSCKENGWKGFEHPHVVKSLEHTMWTCENDPKKSIDDACKEIEKKFTAF